ncbi:sel1 repeat family protein [Massilia sp. CCM 8692]|uniref:Sel1 repeat family protein n=2 Tax=Massilia rubra TaxID=2607910 RepID=A0ABX0LF55_9BURK|nr:sel1 repeat family protein [Massilia rubra]
MSLTTVTGARYEQHHQHPTPHAAASGRLPRRGRPARRKQRRRSASGGNRQAGRLRFFVGRVENPAQAVQGHAVGCIRGRGQREQPAGRPGQRRGTTHPVTQLQRHGTAHSRCQARALGRLLVQPQERRAQSGKLGWVQRRRGHLGRGRCGRRPGGHRARRLGPHRPRVVPLAPGGVARRRPQLGGKLDHGLATRQLIRPAERYDLCVPSRIPRTCSRARPADGAIRRPVKLRHQNFSDRAHEHHHTLSTTPPRAQAYYGAMLIDDNGPGSVEQGVALLRMAAAQDDPSGQSYLARCYETGRGVARDDGQARALFEKAALRGDKPAQRSMANIYERGIGVAADPVRAEEWRKAAGIPVPRPR